MKGADLEAGKLYHGGTGTPLRFVELRTRTTKGIGGRERRSTRAVFLDFTGAEREINLASVLEPSDPERAEHSFREKAEEWARYQAGKAAVAQLGQSEFETNLLALQAQERTLLGDVREAERKRMEHRAVMRPYNDRLRDEERDRKRAEREAQAAAQ